MHEERISILKMVAEGKITAEEGESLLQTLDTPDASQQDSEEQSASEEEQEGFVEILKSGTESLKDQGGLSRDFSRVLRKSARDIERGTRRYRGGGHKVYHEEPGAQMSLETGEQFDLKIDSRHGDIEVKSWAKNSFQIDYEIAVWAEDEVTAKEIASEIEIRVEPEKDASDRATRASITTNYPEEWKLWRNSRPRARVNYWLVVPQQANLEIDSRYAEVSVHDLRGTTTISNRHGNVSLYTIGGDLNLDAHHGNAEADSIQGNVLFKGSHGNAELGKVGGNFEGEYRHGHLELDEVSGDLTLKHRHGSAMVHSVGGVTWVDKSHGPIELEGVRNTFHINANHADTRIDVASPLSGDCVIKGRHAKVDLIAPADAFASIQASTHHGNISSEFEGDLTKKKWDQQFTATLSENAANLQVTNHHGRIDLRCHGVVASEDTHEVDRTIEQSV